MYRKKEGRRDSLRWSEYGTFRYELWGHAIAEGDMVTNNLTVSDCGYPTATTKSRLNAIFAALDIPVTCSVHRKIMQWYVNGVISSGLGKQTLKAGEWTIKIA
jgi:hypothetical protein